MTLRVRIVCGCGRVVQIKDFDDGKEDYTTKESPCECRSCTEDHDGRWDQSECWKHGKLGDKPKPRPRPEDEKKPDPPPPKKWKKKRPAKTNPH